MEHNFTTAYNFAEADELEKKNEDLRKKIEQAGQIIGVQKLLINEVMGGETDAAISEEQIMGIAMDLGEKVGIDEACDALQIQQVDLLCYIEQRREKTQLPRRSSMPMSSLKSNKFKRVLISNFENWFAYAPCNQKQRSAIDTMDAFFSSFPKRGIFII